MQKIADFTFVYQGLNETRGRCQMQVYQLASGMTVVIATELPNTSPCASISKVAATLATQLRWMYVEPGGAMLWIEREPGEAGTFTWVQFRWEGRASTELERRALRHEQVEQLIGENVAHQPQLA
jgi:hypothetical protein